MLEALRQEGPVVKLQCEPEGLETPWRWLVQIYIQNLNVCEPWQLHKYNHSKAMESAWESKTKSSDFPSVQIPSLLDTAAHIQCEYFFHILLTHITIISGNTLTDKPIVILDQYFNCSQSNQVVNQNWWSQISKSNGRS